MQALQSNRQLLAQGVALFSAATITIATIYFQASLPSRFQMESGAIEISQSIHLLCMLLFCLAGARRHQGWRTVFIAAAAVAGMMLIREQNNWFKAELFKGAWQLGVLLVLQPTATYLFKQRANFLSQLKQVAGSPHFMVGMVGVTILLFFSRLVGSKLIWRQLLGDDYSYGIKMFAQESLELLGYSVMLLAVIGLVLTPVQHMLTSALQPAALKP